MTIYSFWLFDRHAECIFHKRWHGSGRGSGPTSESDVAKLIFGIVYSLRNVARKLTNDQSFLTYTASQYKLHYYESPSNLRLVMITTPEMESVVRALQQIYANLFLEFVIKNPLAPMNPMVVDNELFTLGLDAFVSSLPGFA